MKRFKIVIINILMLNLMMANQAVFTYSLPRQSVKKNTPEPVMRMYRYNHLKKEQILNAASVFTSVRVAVDEHKKVVLLYGQKQEVRRFNEYLSKTDTCDVCIEYSTSLIEINRNRLENIGLDWKIIKQNLAAGTLSSQYMNVIQALLSSGEAEVLSHPVVMSRAGETAIIRIGERIPYTVPVQYSSSQSGWQLNYIDSGIDINVVGEHITGNVIRTDLKATVSHIKQWKATFSGDYPVLSNREIDVSCDLDDGESLIIGGLTNTQKRQNQTGIPILSELPLIGGIFKTQTTESDDTEIIFILSPKIVSNHQKNHKHED